jgi:hypothetical protein
VTGATTSTTRRRIGVRDELPMKDEYSSFLRELIAQALTE